MSNYISDTTGFNKNNNSNWNSNKTFKANNYNQSVMTLYLTK